MRATSLLLAVTALLSPVLATTSPIGGVENQTSRRHGEALIPRDVREMLKRQRRRAKRAQLAASGTHKKRSCKAKTTTALAATRTSVIAKTTTVEPKSTSVPSLVVKASSSKKTASQTTPSTSSKMATMTRKSLHTSSANVVAASSSSAFTLANDYSGSNFFDAWDFFTDADPTHGQVTYVDSSTAWSDNLVEITSSGTAKISVDSTTTLASGANRNSVRITSKERFDIGSLVLLDAVKMPYGEGVWPAFWSTTNNEAWPAGGEIDIVEQVNDVSQNQYTLHSTAGCTLSHTEATTGTPLVYDCEGNIGCGTQESSTKSFGSAFNENGGGVYAMSWTDAGIDFYFFPRGSIPSDITSGAPTMKSWGSPSASYSSNTCDMSTYFSPQTLIFDTTLCGDWAGNPGVFNGAGYSGTCSDAVEDPNNFVNAFWEVNYVRIYTAN